MSNWPLEYTGEQKNAYYCFYYSQAANYPKSFNKEAHVLCYGFHLVNLFLLWTLLSVFALLHGVHRRAHPQDLPTAQALVTFVEHGKLGDKHRESFFSSCKQCGEQLQAVQDLLDRQCINSYLFWPNLKKKKEKKPTQDLFAHMSAKHVRGNAIMNLVFSAHFSEVHLFVTTSSQTICLLMCSMGPQVLGRKREDRMWAGRRQPEKVWEPLVCDVMQHLHICSVKRHHYTGLLQDNEFTGHRSSLNRSEH